MSKGKIIPNKPKLHVRNRNRDRYDLVALVVAIPDLKQYLTPNRYGENSVDFANPSAVKLLNKALLLHDYGIDHWEFPDENLCPPVPGRADYLHNMADVLRENHFGNIPRGTQITCLDVGVGAACIYPIIGVVDYGWDFIGTDISEASLATAQNIAEANSVLENHVTFRFQKNPLHIFQGVVDIADRIDLTICNPPFHASAEEATQGAQRKTKNLQGKDTENPVLNFAGIHDELICQGGEFRFIQTMIHESKAVRNQIFWFSTLVSKQAHLTGIYKLLEQARVHEVKTLPMGTGNKSSRIVAWTFLSREAQKDWRESK